MVLACGSPFYQPEHFTRIRGCVLNRLKEQIRSHMIGAACRNEITALIHELHSMQIDILVAASCSFYRAFGLGKGRGIENNNIPCSSSTRSHRHRSVQRFAVLGSSGAAFNQSFDLIAKVIEGVGNNKFHPFLKAIQPNIDFSAFYRMLGNVEAGYLFSSVLASMQCKAPRM
ncbi:hypothetical protein D3C73_898550 [compost metagenome]